MALNKAGLAAELLAIFTDMETRTTDSKAELSNRMADAIDTFVKTGQVQPGIAVTTSGTASAQTGATTAPGTIL